MWMSSGCLGQEENPTGKPHPAYLEILRFSGDLFLLWLFSCVYVKMLQISKPRFKCRYLDMAL